jgi:hypothetical protein
MMWAIEKENATVQAGRVAKMLYGDARMNVVEMLTSGRVLRVVYEAGVWI